MADSRPAFTLRFHDPKTHRALRHAAEELGISMGELAERAIEHELAVIGLELEEKLRQTVKLLGSYRGVKDLDREVEAFARAEIECDDPLRARAASKRHDPLGIGAIFADPVER